MCRYYMCLIPDIKLVVYNVYRRFGIEFWDVGFVMQEVSLVKGTKQPAHKCCIIKVKLLDLHCFTYFLRFSLIPKSFVTFSIAESCFRHHTLYIKVKCHLRRPLPCNTALINVYIHVILHNFREKRNKMIKHFRFVVSTKL